MLDGKFRKVKKCKSTTEILNELDEMKAYSKDVIKLLAEYKKNFEE